MAGADMRNTTAKKIARIRAMDLVKGKRYADPEALAAMASRGLLGRNEAMRAYVAASIIWYWRLSKPYIESIQTIATVFGASRKVAEHALADRFGRERVGPRRWRWCFKKTAPEPGHGRQDSTVPENGESTLPVIRVDAALSTVPAGGAQIEDTATEERTRQSDMSGAGGAVGLTNQSKERRRGEPPSPQRLLLMFQRRCAAINPSVHVHGFMGAPGSLPVDKTVAGDLRNALPDMTEAEWDREIAAWINGEQPTEPDELVIRRFKAWLCRKHGIVIDANGFTPEQNARSAAYIAEKLGTRESRSW